MDPGFPKLIADSWSAVPDDIDAALSLVSDGKRLKLFGFRSSFVSVIPLQRNVTSNLN